MYMCVYVCQRGAEELRAVNYYLSQIRTKNDLKKFLAQEVCQKRGISERAPVFSISKSGPSVPDLEQFGLRIRWEHYYRESRMRYHHRPYR